MKHTSPLLLCYTAVELAQSKPRFRLCHARASFGEVEKPLSLTPLNLTAQ